MNTDEKIEKMDQWVKFFFIMALVMAGIALSAFVLGETNEDGQLVGLAVNVAVVSIVIAGVIILGFMLNFFRGLYLRIIQYDGWRERSVTTDIRNELSNKEK